MSPFSLNPRSLDLAYVADTLPEEEVDGDDPPFSEELNYYRMPFAEIFSNHDDNIAIVIDMVCSCVALEQLVSVHPKVSSISFLKLPTSAKTFPVYSLLEPGLTFCS